MPSFGLRTILNPTDIDDPPRFRSAVDPWFYGLAGGTAAVVAGTMFPLLLDGSVLEMLLAVIVGGPAIALPAWMLSATDYTVEPRTLRVRCGPLRWAIARRDITDVRPTRSMQSAPALSQERLEIRYGRGRSLLVSPADPVAFVHALSRIAPEEKTPPADAQRATERGAGD
jgi:hypothetical protein